MDAAVANAASIDSVTGNDTAAAIINTKHVMTGAFEKDSHAAVERVKRVGLMHRASLAASFANCMTCAASARSTSRIRTLSSNSAACTQQ